MGSQGEHNRVNMNESGTKMSSSIRQTELSQRTPWTIAASTSPIKTSLADVMSEQLAAQLSTSPKNLLDTNLIDSLLAVRQEFPIPLDIEEQIVPGTTEQEDSDRTIAQLLQYELDLEHDDILQRQERHRNGPSKITVSLANYRHLHPAESRDELQPLPDFPEPNFSLGKLPEFNSRGYCGQGKNIITKHDADVCGRRNAERVMANFPPNFATGDDFDYDSKLPNKVFNELKVHGEEMVKRGKRTKDKKDDDATATFAVDSKTRLQMYKLVNNGVLDTINGVIATGKESVVFHAVGGIIEETGKKLPEECAIKVFKTTLNEFRHRDPYIRNDYRFQDRFSKLNPRKIVRLWAEKEMLNLKRMTEHGLPCPEPFILRKHILVLKFLGTDQKAAPKLKDVALSMEDRNRAYEETVQIMMTMYNKCKLVHADFSEYNLLWHENKVWVIDVSQSVEPAHPRAMEFLYRDCRNVENFFNKLEVKQTMKAKDLMEMISGIKLESDGEGITTELNRYDSKKDKPHRFDPDFDGASFDYLFDLANRERSQEQDDKDEQDEQDEHEDWELVDEEECDSSEEEVLF